MHLFQHENPQLNSNFINSEVIGEFENQDNQRYYVIRNIDKMSDFFISLVSSGDHWMFISSNGGLTAGRSSPESALFPYIPVDRVHDSITHTGSKTIFRVYDDEKVEIWEPLKKANHYGSNTQRNLYKSLIGDKLCFEEVNQDLQMAFRYFWMFSDAYGFIRQSELKNLSSRARRIDFIDGLQNILPAGVPHALQTNSSNLVDAYKCTELDKAKNLAFFTLYSGITDRPEPRESLRANTVFSLGVDDAKILLSNRQLRDFQHGSPLQTEFHTRGLRGAYLINSSIKLQANASKSWQIIANVEQSQNQIQTLRQDLTDSAGLFNDLQGSIEQNSIDLKQIVATMDGLQQTAEENVSVHHFANVLFNGMRGGVFKNQYIIDAEDFMASIKQFNRPVYEKSKGFLQTLPRKIERSSLLAAVNQQGSRQLERLCYEFLPLTFSRRHGDPSRPWNKFSINIKDQHGSRLINYQGNWRDIFQNWEALLFSYPDYIESVIAKFVNAGTIDGYNPYRITNNGIDWEVENDNDPWSYIGYWGDHQIIYLLKLLEMSQDFHPGALNDLLQKQIFSYANVPYRIKPFVDILNDLKNTIVYDDELEKKINSQVKSIGADGKLLLNADAEVHLVNLAEKLLVTLLSKLGNLVPDGGIWLNTQRPEWNDANNALVGQGLSVVTLCYLRRYVVFLLRLFKDKLNSISLSSEVCAWLSSTSKVLVEIVKTLKKGQISASQRFSMLEKLGQAASNFRELVYKQKGFKDTKDYSVDKVVVCLDNALFVIDRSIVNNRRSDGLYHSYNITDFDDHKVHLNRLDVMLEGQVAGLSSGKVTASATVLMLEALFNSNLYREDQKSFMLYPDRELPGFLEKNYFSIATELFDNDFFKLLSDNGDQRLITVDGDNYCRFNPDLISLSKLEKTLDSLENDYEHLTVEIRQAIVNLYKKVFNHQSFTGRSGGMFGFEGLGCIYWHMVAKLLLAVQEKFFQALLDQVDTETCDKLGQLYYQVRQGIGFNKTPYEYGAFPTDPYSHTPKHSGAQQPGMTGQVKEEILTRFKELGIVVSKGRVRFQPELLRQCEFSNSPATFTYFDVMENWRKLHIPANSIAFTWCQVPIVYILDESVNSCLRIFWQEGQDTVLNSNELSTAMSQEIFQRTGKINRIIFNLQSKQLFKIYPNS